MNRTVETRFQIERLEDRIVPTGGLLGLGGIGAGFGADVGASANVGLNVLNLISLGVGLDVDGSAGLSASV